MASERQKGITIMGHGGEWWQINEASTKSFPWLSSIFQIIFYELT
jgi:hypothetical protein